MGYTSRPTWSPVGGALKDLKKDEIYLEWEVIPLFLEENEKLITKDFARKVINAWNNKKDFQGKLPKKVLMKQKKIMMIGWQEKGLTSTKQLVNYQTQSRFYSWKIQIYGTI